MTAEFAGRYTGLTRPVALEKHSLYRKIERIVAAMPAGRVLEVGCLDGRYLDQLAGRGWSVAGIDIMPGGTLILTTPNLLFGLNRLRMLIGQTPKFAYADYHVRMFVWDDLREKIERHFTIERVQGSHVLAGVQRSRWFEVFAALGDRLPRLSAHFIVTARTRNAGEAG